MFFRILHKIIQFVGKFNRPDYFCHRFYITLEKIMSTEKIVTYSAELDNSQIEKLHSILKNQGYTFTGHEHMIWKASRPGLGISVYKSRKVVIQGKETHDFVLFTLEPEILKKASLGYEKVLINQPAEAPFAPHIGIDESGKGDFFGPLVIGAAFVDDESSEILTRIGVKDSKEIKNDKKIVEISDKIKRIVKGKYSIVAIGNEAYNRLYFKIRNLNRLLAWGHARALENLLGKNIDCTFAISDQFGDKKLIQNALLEAGRKIELIQKTKAESDIAVAAASIIARAEFVRRMDKLSEEIKIKLPKGASAQVKETALKIIECFGEEKLKTMSKTHFKTYAEIITAHKEK